MLKWAVIHPPGNPEAIALVAVVPAVVAAISRVVVAPGRTIGRSKIVNPQHIMI